MQLNDGTYEYTGNYGVNITATVQEGRVVRWERNGESASVREYVTIDFTACLKRELADPNRSNGFLHPIKFTPADAGTVYVPVTVGTAQRGHLCFTTNGSRL